MLLNGHDIDVYYNHDEAGLVSVDAVCYTCDPQGQAPMRARLQDVSDQARSPVVVAQARVYGFITLHIKTAPRDT